MKIAKSIFLVFALAVGAPSIFGVEKAITKRETSHLVFVTEYIRELGAIENIRVSVTNELEDTTIGKISDAIHASTLFQLELGSQIKMLKGMHLKPPFDWLIPSLITFDEHRIAAYQRIANISTTFLSGPKPGVDYGKLTAEMSKTRAELDYIDKAQFEASAVVFSTLIDMKPDSKNQANHLIITKEERTKLIDDLQTKFGLKIDQDGQNYTVSTASVLKGYLLKDFKSSDDPWE